MGIKFESVRLTHAQAAPDHYFANQVYQPIDDDHRGNGSFLILFDHSNNPDAIFVASLVNTLIREYYRTPSSDRLSCFEQTLVRLNDQIKQYTANRESTLPMTLSGIIVLCLGKEIHITYIGSPYALLMRKGEFIPLVDELGEDEPTTSFSLITSGEIHDNDLLILLSQSYGPQTKEDISFALTQQPIYESGRAFARLLKQKSDYLVEGQFVRFDPDSEGTYQVYLDRPLETSTEKMQHYRSLVTKQGHYLMNGFHFGKEKINTIREKKSSPPAEATVSSAKNQEESPPIPVPAEASNEEVVDFEVRNYWQSRPSPQEHPPALKTTRYNVHSPTAPRGKIHVKPRTIYLLVGILIIMFILIRVINAMSSNKGAGQTSIVDRSAIIALAEEKERAAETARLQNNNTDAINNYLVALNELEKVPDSQANEQTKALSERILSAFDRLTATTRLKDPTNSIAANAEAKKLLLVGETIFVIHNDNTLSKLTGDSLEEVPLPDSFEIIDATSVEKALKIALLVTQEDKTKLYISDVGTLSFEAKARSDGKDWPKTHVITSYDKNLYVVGNTMSKATPRDNGYRITSFSPDNQTDAVTSIIEREGFFYAIENGSTIIRIDAKGPKTVVKIHEVPESFLPNQFSILPAGDGTIWLVDTETGRLMNMTTDGAYKSQIVLPKGSKYSSCITAADTLYCGGENTIQSFSLKK